MIVKSICCDSEVNVEGRETKYYVCQECGQPCDTIHNQ